MLSHDLILVLKRRKKGGKKRKEVFEMAELEKYESCKLRKRKDRQFMS